MDRVRVFFGGCNLEFDELFCFIKFIIDGVFLLYEFVIIGFCLVDGCYWEYICIL